MDKENLEFAILEWQRACIPVTTFGELLAVFRWYRVLNDESLLRKGRVNRASIVVHVPSHHRHFFVNFVNNVHENDRKFVTGLHDDERIAVSGYVEERPTPPPPTDLVDLLKQSGGGER